MAWGLDTLVPIRLQTLTLADYGSPPYHESGFKAVLRRLASGAGPILMGLGTPVRPGASFLETLGASGATSYRAASAAQQAAQEYAMKQQQMEEDRQNREISQAYTQALTKQLEKPPKPEPPTKDEEAKRILGRDLTPQERQILAGVYKEPKQPDTQKPDRTALLDTNTIADNFRQEKDVQNHTVVRDNARRIKGALDQGTGYGDLAAIFAFMRVLDPNSVVRETEFANAEAASGFLQRVLNIPGKVVQGNRLTPQARLKIKSMTDNLAKTQEQTYQKTVGRYKNLAKKFGVDPSLIITDYGDSTATPANDPLGIR